MCKLLKVSRSLVYYHLNNRESSYSHEDSKIEKHIIKIFHRSKNNYGTRKIKVELEKLGQQVGVGERGFLRENREDPKPP